jgi:mannose-6-phosphate isomerase-like protein (cupin superfamily)
MQGFVGGIGLTHLTVYEQRPAPDGIMSGCAHVHAGTDEGYYVLGGTGAVELHDLERGFRSVPLARGAFVQFPPGTLHRSVSTGGLEVLAIMGNAGLAERGDARVYFGRAVDADPVEFDRLTGLPAARGLEGALERRDASVRAYMELMRLWRDDPAAYRLELQRFITLHASRFSVAAAGAQALIESGLALEDDAVARFGMCGTLKQYHAPTPV